MANRNRFLPPAVLTLSESPGAKGANLEPAASKSWYVFLHWLRTTFSYLLRKAPPRSPLGGATLFGTQRVFLVNASVTFLNNYGSDVGGGCGLTPNAALTGLLPVGANSF
jgi:hypothetical protein